MLSSKTGHPPPLDSATPVYDLIGVGFGPSNLALAIALHEHNARHGFGERVTGHFLERQPTFGWHRGMLIDDATMQVSFLKDLVTLRDPTSGFSFLCYLRERDRLADFINHKSLFPLRVEFHDYFEWAAAKVDDQVSYASEVTGVVPVRDVTGRVTQLDVTTATARYRARNLVLATGLRPRLPAGVTAGPRVWHTSGLLDHVRQLAGTHPRRFVVVGAGQSAAETVAYLHRAFPAAAVHAVFSRYGFSPADDSPFANRVFDPGAVVDYFGAPEPVKRDLMRYHRGTNYAVVDIDLIEDLYRREYQEKVLGQPRLHLHRASRVTAQRLSDTGVQVRVASDINGTDQVLDADAIVYATGYDEADTMGLLGELAALVDLDEHSRPPVDRDYRLRTTAELTCGIYLQGGTEHSHGLTSSLLSNTAVRVAEILESVRRHRHARPDAAAIPAGLAIHH